MRVADQLRASGKVTRGRIGVQISEVGKDVAEAIGLPKAEGALVSNVESDGPAEDAGVKPGDVITSFHGERSEEHTSELQSLMRNSYAVFCLKKKNRQKNHNRRRRRVR